MVTVDLVVLDEVFKWVKSDSNTSGTIIVDRIVLHRGRPRVEGEVNAFTIIVEDCIITYTDSVRMTPSSDTGSTVVGV